MAEHGNNIVIGNGVHIFRHTEISAKNGLPVVIGNNVYINQRCLIRPNTTIGSGVAVGPDVMFMTDSHEIGKSDFRAGPNSYPPIKVSNGCWIGARVTILGGVTIGQGTVIAAGSVVNKDCLPDSLYAGVPAHLIKRLDED